MASRRCLLPPQTRARSALIAVCFAVAVLAWPAPSPVRAGDAAIPSDRVVDWRPGVVGGIPDVPTKVRLTAQQFAAGATEGGDAGPAINQAIASVNGRGAVMLPAGTFHVRSRINMKSGVILRGLGARQTRLVFDAPKVSWNGGICFLGSVGREAFALEDGMRFGKSVVTLAEPTDKLEVGQTIWVVQDNDRDLMRSDKWHRDYANESMGQLVAIEKIEGKTIHVDRAFRLDHKASLKPRLRVITPIEHAGIEDLAIERKDQAEDYVIGMTYAQNCWMRNVELSWCTRAHVWVFYSRFITVADSLIHHAHNYGGGGHGYGVVLGNCTSDSLVVNNIFHTLRHAMMVKQGANGNVFAFNYSFDSKHPNDISIHGHYSFANLFEGNVVEQITFADWWGPTGPRTTAFRNRVTKAAITVKDGSHLSNVVGNTVLRSGVLVTPDCKGVLVRANLQGSSLAHARPEGESLPASLYLDAKPDWWGKHAWPAIGSDVDADGDMAPIPAMTRWEAIKASRE